MRRGWPGGMHGVAFVVAALVGWALPLGWGSGGREAEELPAEPSLAALLSPQESREYGEAFWLREAREESHLWEQAVGLCTVGLGASTPGCMTVFRVEIVSRLERGSDDPR